MTMEELFASQYQLMDAFDKLLINFKKDGADRKTAYYIKKKIETLDAY